MWREMNSALLTLDPTYASLTGSHGGYLPSVKVTMLQKQLTTITTTFPFTHRIPTLAPLLFLSTCEASCWSSRKLLSCFFSACQLWADSSADLAQTNADAFDFGLIIFSDRLILTSVVLSTYTFVTILVRVDITRFKTRFYLKVNEVQT